jgi:hypothetical protein
MKRLAYQTTDGLNEATADVLAGHWGGEMLPLLLRDPPPDGQFDAVLYDLDYLPPERRQEILAQLLAGPTHVPTGVHSFNLDEDQAEALRRQGVVVSRRLDRDLIRRLLNLAGAMIGMTSLVW